jgi:uncharacterized membrane protein HdeD (DUF308 family)
MLFIFGVVSVGAGILIILKPTMGWYSQQWMFKDDIPEPSDTFISIRKFIGIIVLIVGLLLIAGGVMNTIQEV